MSAGAVSSRSAARSRPRWITTSAGRFRVVALVLVQGGSSAAPPRLGRRAAVLWGGEVDQPFEQEQRLGLAGAADGVDRHGVGEGAVEVDADRRDAVEARDYLGQAGG